MIVLWLHQDGLRKVVEDVRQPVSKTVSFYNRSHATTAPAKSFNAFEYSDKNLDRAGVTSNIAARQQQQQEMQQHQQQHFYGSQTGMQGMPLGLSLQGSMGGMMPAQHMRVPLGSTMGGGYPSYPESGRYMNQNYHPNVEHAMYRSGGGGLQGFASEQPMYRSGGADLRHSFTDKETLA